MAAKMKSTAGVRFCLLCSVFCIVVFIFSLLSPFWRSRFTDHHGLWSFVSCSMQVAGCLRQVAIFTLQIASRLSPVVPRLVLGVLFCLLSTVFCLLYSLFSLTSPRKRQRLTELLIHPEQLVSHPGVQPFRASLRPAEEDPAQPLPEEGPQHRS